MSLLRRHWALLGPSLMVVLFALGAQLTSSSLQLQARSVLVTACIVVAMQVFIGVSGVISFGHISFVALGAFAAGVATSPADLKPTAFPDMFPFLANLEIGSVQSLMLAALLGGLYAFLVGIPIMRLSGLAAGIATFAVLIITNNVFRNWEGIGPGAKTLPQIPETSGFLQVTVGLLGVMAVAYLYQRSRYGRMLRATREDPPAAQSSGVDIHRQRLMAFTLSGVLSGFAGGLLVHLVGSITTNQVFLDLTFITLAMLVIGGIGSLWGAVIGAMFIATLNTVLFEAENGLEIASLAIDLPIGSRLIGLALAMLLVVLFRPEGITRGKELRWPFGKASLDGRSDPISVGDKSS